MWTILIIKHKILLQAFIEFYTIFRNTQINMFILHGSPQPFNENIINGPSLAIHADLYALVQ